jgi:hypothetical protein
MNHETKEGVTPTASTLRGKMINTSDELYKAWRQILMTKLESFELRGRITFDDTPPELIKASRLPNQYLNFVRSRLQSDLKDAGYDSDFRFDTVSEPFLTDYRIDISD